MSNESSQPYAFRAGSSAAVTYHGGRGMVVIGETERRALGRYYRTVAVFNATKDTIKAIQNCGGIHTRRGDISEFVFDGNTQSCLVISDTVGIRQALHLTGHQRHLDCWQYHSNDPAYIEALFNSLVDDSKLNDYYAQESE